MFLDFWIPAQNFQKSEKSAPSGHSKFVSGFPNGLPGFLNELSDLPNEVLGPE